jgi:hypothetical protein
MILFIGRLLNDGSPTIVESNRCPERIPDSKRIVVPEFPASKGAKGLLNPLGPFP